MTVLSPSAAADLILTLDPVAEDATNVPFELVSDSTGARLVEQNYPSPVPVVTWASSSDSEGDRAVSYRWPNRKITLKVELIGATVRTRVNNLEQKVAKIAREGGTLKHVFPDGHYMVFDLLALEGYEPTLDVAYFVGNVCMVTLEFTAKPFYRQAAVQLSDHTETTLPALIFTETAVTGDAPALGRLIVDEDQGADQQWAVWGMQRDTYSSAASAALFYEAEIMTPQSAGAIVTQTGASGGGSNNAIESTVGTSYSSVISTQRTGIDADGRSDPHLSHRGSYRVFARVLTPSANTGAVSWALEWGVGDFRRYTRNATTTFPVDTWDGTFRIVDLGVVNIPKVQLGTQQWEGRILAKSTVAGDKVRIDHFFMVPMERSGEVRSVPDSPAPTVYSARDGFDQAAGSLTGKTLPIGGTWGGAGDADDFSVTGSSTITRVAVSDTATSVASGRLVTASTPSLANTVVSVDVTFPPYLSSNPPSGGVIARYVDASNFLIARLTPSTNSSMGRFLIEKVVAGVPTTMTSEAHDNSSTRAIRLTVSPNGDVLGQVLSTSGTALISRAVNDVVLATGAALATGKVGIMDWHPYATVATRTYDNFYAYSPPVDAAVFASQSIEWRDDGILRENSAGTIYQPPSSYEGDYHTIKPYAQEAKPVRYIVKLSRGIPGVGPDSAVDDLSARLTITPRGLVVPD